MKGAARTGFWVAVGLALVISLGLDVFNVASGGAIDLRNRVTGVRLMEHGIDPYTYKWRYGDLEQFCDVYDNPKLPVSKTTATPALLLLHAPLAALNYRDEEFCWLCAQWFCLAGLLAIGLVASETELARRLVAAFVAAFTYTAAWRLHAERGQAYVLLALVFAGWLVLTLHRRWGVAWWTGLLAGGLVALRPTFLLLAPFVALHRRGQLPGFVLGLGLGFGAPMLLLPSCWADYFSAMQVNSHLYRNDINPRPGPQHYPGLIEGTGTDLLAAFAIIPYADASVFELLRWLRLERAWPGSEAVPAWPPLLAVGLAFAVWLWLTLRRAPESLLAGLAAWLFLADFFLPAFRNSYNDVLVLDLVIVALAARIGPDRLAQVPWGLWPCVAALPVGWWIYVQAPERVSLINLPTALFVLGAAIFVVALRRPAV